MVNYSSLTRKSLSFAFTPRRWLQFFVVDAAFFLIFLLLLGRDWISNISAFILISINPPLMFEYSVFPIILPFIILGIIWILIRLFVTGAIIHQSYKEKEFEKSFTVAKKKYFSLLAAIIVISILFNLIGYIPFIGFIFTIIFTLIFFVALQAIVIKNMGFYEGLKTSWIIFKNKPKEIIITFIIVGIISLLIIGVFSIPLFLLFFNYIVPTLTVSDSNILSLLIIYLITNLPNVIASILAFILGSSIAYTFGLKAQTEIYLKLRKKSFFMF